MRKGLHSGAGWLRKWQASASKEPSCQGLVARFFCGSEMRERWGNSEVKWKSLSQVWLFTTPGVGSHSLPQGIFPTQESHPGLPHRRQIPYHLSHQGGPGNKVQRVFNPCRCPLEWQASGRGLYSFHFFAVLHRWEAQVTPWGTPSCTPTGTKAAKGRWSRRNRASIKSKLPFLVTLRDS